MSTPRSIRFDDEVRARLDRYVRDHPGMSASAVTNLFVDEALRAAEHPGIVFRDGPTGRRAGLVAGPDVWEVVESLHAVRREDATLAENDLLTATAESLGLSTQRVRTAIRYYAAYPSEVDERIESHHAETDRAERLWLAEQDLLGSAQRGESERGAEQSDT